MKKKCLLFENIVIFVWIRVYNVYIYAVYTYYTSVSYTGTLQGVNVRLSIKSNTLFSYLFC